MPAWHPRALFDPSIQTVVSGRGARGVALGVAVHFVLSSGVAKLWVGGGPAWMAPATMRTYLGVYRSARSGVARPLSPRLSAWLAERDWATAAIAWCTVALE